MRPGSGFTYGILSMGFIVQWIIFFPYYGPALAVLQIHSLIPPHLFTLTHIIGLIGGSWFYYHYRDHPLACLSNSIASIALAILTLSPLLAGLDLFSMLALPVFVLMGLFSGWVSSRWMTWFSSSATYNHRGAVLGKAIGACYILLVVNILVLAVQGKGLTYSLIIGALVILSGGLMTNRLPINFAKRTEPLPLSALMPQLDLILYGICAYSTISLIYRSVLSTHLKHSLFFCLEIIPFIVIGFLLGKWSDKNERYYFTIIAFLLVGMAFLIQAATPAESYYSIYVGILVMSGLVCIHLFYWLSLVDRQKTRYAPFSLVTGISIELVACAVVFSLVPLLPSDPDRAEMIVGITGAALILLGFFIISTNLYQMQAKIILKTKPLFNQLEKNAIASPESIDHIQLPALVYLFNLNRELFEETLAKQFNLTQREVEVVCLLFLGYKYTEITKILYISMNTLKFHIKNIYQKIGASTREEAAEIAYAAVKTAEST